MNNKELIQLIYDQRPAPEQLLDIRIHNRLARLAKEEQAMKKRVKLSVVLIAAIVFVLLMSTAFALGYSRLMDYLGKDQLKPIEGAENLIQTDFGEAIQQEEIVFHVEEAIFDGKTAVVQMLLTPVDSENVFLLHQGIQDTPEDVYEVTYIQDDYGGEYRMVTGRKDGKKIISYSVGLHMANEDENYIFESNTLDGEELSDGSVRVWMEGSVVSGSVDTLELLLRSTYAPLEKMDDLENRQVFEKRITLASAQEANHVVFAITQNNMDARVQILAAEAKIYPLRGEMTIDYLYEENAEAEPMGITFKLYAKENEIAVGSGERMLLETSADGKKQYREVCEIEAFAHFPETIVLEAKVIGQPRTLGQATLSAKETEKNADAAIETDRPGLYFVPNGSWKGKQITLLAGEIYPGRKIMLSYAYEGDRMNLPYVKFVAPDGSGVGEIINEVTVIKKDCYAMEATLSGSGWPASMRVEFVSGSEVIDVFMCDLLPTKR